MSESISRKREVREWVRQGRLQRSQQGDTSPTLAPPPLPAGLLSADLLPAAPAPAGSSSLEILPTEDRLLATSSSADEHHGLTTQLKQLMVDFNPRSLTCFLPVRGEPDTRAFIEWARQLEIEVLLPAASENGLLNWVRAGAETVKTGIFGIDVPTGEALEPEASHTVDLMLVPAAAVDLHGTRLGWGRGYYDRNLAAMHKRPPVFAVVHDEEVFERLPAEPHDIPMTGVVTPSRILRFTD